MARLFGKSATKTHSSNSIGEKKALFLEQDSLLIFRNPIIAGNLQRLSQLPPQTDIHEWMATNSLAFFTHVNVQFGAVSEMCTQQTCPVMSAGKETFDWLDDRKGKAKSTRVPAKQFINSALTQIQEQLRDEEIFPTKFGFEFPVDFVSIVRKIFRTYFAILAHIYHHHFHETHRLDLHDGLNTLFLHFMVFVLEFSLLEPKEYSCMEELFIKLQAIAADAAKHPQSEDDLSAHGSAP